MNIFIFEEKATQAKLVLHKQFAVIKLPRELSFEQKSEVRNKFLKLIEINQKEWNWDGNASFSLKVYYKIGTPYIFLNRRVENNKRETIATYNYNDL
jgi:hypothetical protein